MNSLSDEFRCVLEDPLSYFNNINLENLPNFIGETNLETNREESLRIAVCCLMLFIIENFTGPSIVSSLNSSVLSKIKEILPESYLDDINVDGETIHELTCFSELIWIAYKLIVGYSGPSEWIGRVACVIQKCLSGPSMTMKDLALKNLKGLELAIAHRLFQDYQAFFAELEEYRKSISFEFSLTGKMGKKTKFQQDSKAQLALIIHDCKSIREGNQKKINTVDSLNEREVKLDEDISRLERPSMDEVHEIPELSFEELCFLIQEARAIGDRNAGEEVRDEKRIPLLTTVLDSKTIYDITTCALFDKSKLEQYTHSTQPRAVLQLESIIKDFSNNETPALERTRCFFILEHPPLWEVRREMGIQMMKIGAARTAANIFIEHRMWDELGMCCEIANDASIAIPVLEEQTATPLVLTILGELKKSKELLEKAWIVSRQRFSRSQRSLAKIYLKEKDWKLASHHFEIALALNKLYPAAWFSLGCCFMRLEQFEKAISCLQEVVSQNPDDSECFSNLSVCFTTIGKNAEAHKAMTQAIRFDRQNAKIWENFIVVSLNANVYNDCIYGLEELIRAFPKWCNVPLLHDIILTTIEKNRNGLERLNEVLNKISQSADCTYEFWLVYAELIESYGEPSNAFDMRISAIKELEKDGKVRDQNIFDKLVSIIGKLCNTTDKVPEKKKSLVSRIKVTIKKYEEDFSTLESYIHLQELLEKLE